MLLDEPLANLDYKLREELRAELPRIFAEAGSIFVYATTEPTEALLLGGNTATLSRGPRHAVRPDHRSVPPPDDLMTARTFSDPPLNTIVMRKRGRSVRCSMAGSHSRCPRDLRGIADGTYTIGFQPHHLSLQPAGAGRGCRSRRA